MSIWKRKILTLWQLVWQETSKKVYVINYKEMLKNFFQSFRIRNIKMSISFTSFHSTSLIGFKSIFNRLQYTKDLIKKR